MGGVGHISYAESFKFSAFFQLKSGTPRLLDPGVISHIPERNPSAWRDTGQEEGNDRGSAVVVVQAGPGDDDGDGQGACEYREGMPMPPRGGTLGP